MRREIIEEHWDEIEKMAIGLQSGQLEAFEMFGALLAELVQNQSKADMYMAVLFEVLPPAAQRKMLSDARIEESTTIAPIVKELRDTRPKAIR